MTPKEMLEEADRRFVAAGLNLAAIEPKVTAAFGVYANLTRERQELWAAYREAQLAYWKAKDEFERSLKETI